MTGEVFGELPARELVGADDTVHDARLLEHDEIAVHRALREPVPGFEDLRDRQRARSFGEGGHECVAVGGESLAHTPQPFGDGLAHVVGALRHVCNVPEANPGQYRREVEPTEQFAALVAGPEAELALDRAAFLIAAHAHPDLDVDGRLHELDQLAANAHASDASTLARVLFQERGFKGNAVDYGDPRNSLFDDVLDRRLGIPITLSVLMIEVGRRLGISLHGVGMPGHFLVGSRDGFFDAFADGVALDEAACIDRFAATQPRDAFRREFLAAVGPRRIVDRMLNNLQHCYLARLPASAAWPARLRLLLPDQPPAVRVELAGVLGRLGRFSEAAAAIDAVAAEVDDSRGEQLRRTAARFRARAN
jgi:regulator of sirC expression with transglutaminase-like and TPR domain